MVYAPPDFSLSYRHWFGLAKSMHANAPCFFLLTSPPKFTVAGAIAYGRGLNFLNFDNFGTLL